MCGALCDPRTTPHPTLGRGGQGVGGGGGGSRGNPPPPPSSLTAGQPTVGGCGKAASASGVAGGLHPQQS